MEQEEKQLLLKDICTRLPYGIRYKGDGGWGINPYQHTTSLCTILNSEEPLVYLRPMSSMTEEEKDEYDRRKEENDRKMSEYERLPWYKRPFNKKPLSFTDEKPIQPKLKTGPYFMPSEPESMYKRGEEIKSNHGINKNAYDKFLKKH